MATAPDTGGVPVDHTRNGGPRFAHPSERVAAEILDYYHVDWQYEPTAFPLEWDAKGNVIAWFTPDFYLPDFDLYIELTTMSQKLVTKKNRKVRRLKELHPEINVKVLYQKDFRRLLQRFGIAPVEIPHADGGGVVSAAHGGDPQGRTAPSAPQRADAEGSDGDVARNPPGGPSEQSES